VEICSWKLLNLDVRSTSTSFTFPLAVKSPTRISIILKYIGLRLLVMKKDPRTVHARITMHSAGCMFIAMTSAATRHCRHQLSVFATFYSIAMSTTRIDMRAVLSFQ
jgi:hypothetical protein